MYPTTSCLLILTSDLLRLTFEFLPLTSSFRLLTSDFSLLTFDFLSPQLRRRCGGSYVRSYVTPRPRISFTLDSFQFLAYSLRPKDTLLQNIFLIFAFDSLCATADSRFLNVCLWLPTSDFDDFLLSSEVYEHPTWIIVGKSYVSSKNSWNRRREVVKSEVPRGLSKCPILTILHVTKAKKITNRKEKI